MKNNDNFIEVDFFQKNKAGNVVCGDSFMSQKLKGEGRIISVLSDGLGSGIKASVLQTAHDWMRHGDGDGVLYPRPARVEDLLYGAQEGFYD